ncbi:MAG: cytochrome C [Pelodictyon luteolum]|uniref:Cytochrome C n=1 Tax=Pelodictyon luteolum TaxID=1100 RepID=A0A165L4A1_PELLU|nr:heme-binding domain-containing protein [Pelodictyon luteolum]KZK73554.1 MAG: cytochrome C [Pelodictyon luteolum]
MKPLKIVAISAAVLILIQFVPFGRDHLNPPVTGEPAWDSPETRELFFRGCRDCHSNETVWPWYSNVAPFSWLASLDVSIGREKFNVSEWGRQGRNEGEEAAEEVREGKMPPWFYMPAHPEAKLSPEEKVSLTRGLEATFGTKGGDEKSGH